MASPYPRKITVELSREDRQLLRDIRDALRAAGVAPEDEDEAVETTEHFKRRLVELHDDRERGGYIKPTSGVSIAKDDGSYLVNGEKAVPKDDIGKFVDDIVYKGE